MTLALSTLVPSLQRAMSTPGNDFFPDALPSEWVGRLADAFMDAKVRGMFSAWGLSADNTAIEPKDPAGDDPDDVLQRLIVLYAALNTLITQLTNLTTLSKYQAGPALMETQRSAQVLKDVLAARRSDLAEMTDLIASQRSGTLVAFSAITIRDRLMRDGIDPWIN